MFDALDIGVTRIDRPSGFRLDVIAGNIANASTTHDAAGKPNPYRRRFAVIAAGARRTIPRSRASMLPRSRKMRLPFGKKFEPTNPDAGADGYVQLPNVDPTVEFVNAIEASRRLLKRT